MEIFLTVAWWLIYVSSLFSSLKELKLVHYLKQIQVCLRHLLKKTKKRGKESSDFSHLGCRKKYKDSTKTNSSEVKFLTYWKSKILKDENQNSYFCARGDVQPRTPEKHCKTREKHQNHIKISHDKGGKSQKISKRSRSEQVSSWKSCFGKRRGRQRRGGKNIKSVRKHVGLFLSGCHRSTNTLHPRFKSLHAENEKTFSPCRNTKNRKEEKEDKNMLKKMAVGNVLTERE